MSSSQVIGHEITQILYWNTSENHESTHKRKIMKHLIYSIFAALTALILSACGGGSSDSSKVDTSKIKTQSISINFDAVANGVSVDCDSELTGLGTAGTDAQLRDFRFYIHDIQLITDHDRTLAITLDDNIWQSNGAVLLDFQNKGDSCSGDDKQTNSSVIGEVAIEDGESIVDLRFTLGLPTSLNHQNPTTAPSPMNISSLTWGWQAGYKFMRVDVAPTGGVTRPSDGTFNNSTWNMHLGSTDCSGNPQLGETVSCGFENRPVIELTGFDPDSDTVLVDYGNLIANVNLGQDIAGAPGCMSGTSDPECQTVFDALGLDSSTGAANPGSPQTVFRIE